MYNTLSFMVHVSSIPSWQIKKWAPNSTNRHSMKELIIQFASHSYNTSIIIKINIGYRKTTYL